MSQSDKPNGYIEPTKLDSVFATTACGQLLEIPESEFESFVVSSERMQALGHPPIGGAPAADGGGEEAAGGRHMIPGGGTGDAPGWSWHTSWEFGAFLGPDGSFYTGIHRHPDGDQRAVPAEPRDFT